MKIATAAYPLDWFDDWSEYEIKLSGWIQRAAEAGADLLVFPEYGAMELASLAGAEDALKLDTSARAVAERIPDADRLHAQLATRHSVHILASSGPVFDRSQAVNRARFFGPDGAFGHQDKQIMTRFEREAWGIQPGDPLTLFDTDIGRIGVLICYDCEFPLLARALTDAGAEILLVPSNTEAHSGYSRVRIGAMARALENQCVVVQSPTVGPAPWCEAVDENTGAAAIYAPPDVGFPASGILAMGGQNDPGWVYAELDLSSIADVRRNGNVLNHSDWSLQPSVSNFVKLHSMRA